jgi:8-oxo-dGTP pyrophosphatase MutT (NUDIX family)
MTRQSVIEFLGLKDYFPLGQLLCTGFENIGLIKEEEARSFSPEDSERIKTSWREHLERNPKDYDGCVGSVVSLSQFGGRLTIKFREAKFSEFYATQTRRPEVLDVKSRPLDREFCLPLSFGAVAVTKPVPPYSKGCLVFAKRGETAFDAGDWTLLPGGYFDPKKDYFLGEDGRVYSIFVTILRELFEELRVSRFESVNFLGLVYSKRGSRQPLLAASLQLPFTAEELKEITRTGEEEEVEQIFFVENDIFAVRTFLQGKSLAIHDAWKLLLFFDKDT